MIRRNPFRRAVEVPGDVLSRFSAKRGDKVLAAAQAADGTWLLGTLVALHILRPGAVDAEPAETRIPWEGIERVDWNREEDRLVVSEVGEFGRVRPRHVFAVSEPGVLLELVRERVTASVVLQRRVFTHGKRGLLVIGRRPPARDGEVLWSYEFDAGVDPDDPDVMAAAEAGLRAAQEELGL